MNNEVEELRGQIGALSVVLAQVIATLPKMSRAQAAAGLAIEWQTIRNADIADEVAHAEAAQRDTLIEAYLGLLSAP